MAFDSRTTSYFAVAATSLALFAALPSSAQGEQISARGAGFANTGQLATFGLYNNAIITNTLNLKRINDNFVFLSDNPNDPLDQASGSCFGGAVVKNMQIQGGGVCSLKDKDGAPFAISYKITKIENGEYSGDWAILGGDEKWSTAKGNGIWTRITLPNMSMSVSTITGEITF